MPIALSSSQTLFSDNSIAFPPNQFYYSTRSTSSNMMEDEDYFLPPSIVSRLQQLLQSRVDPAHQVFLYSHLKDNVRCRGVRMQEIRFAVAKWHTNWRTEQQTIPRGLEFDVALKLFECEYHEDQLASIVFIDEILIQQELVTDARLPQFALLFDRNLITNYKVCDHFSAKVLQPLINLHGASVANRISDWFMSPSLMKARCALGALVPFAADAMYDDLILDGCRKLVLRGEAHAWNVVATALKALGKRDSNIVNQFFEEDANLACMSAQSLKKSCESLTNTRFRQLSERRKLLVQQNVAVIAEEEMKQQLEALRSEAGPIPQIEPTVEASPLDAPGLSEEMWEAELEKSQDVPMAADLARSEADRGSL